MFCFFGFFLAFCEYYFIFRFAFNLPLFHLAVAAIVSSLWQGKQMSKYSLSWKLNASPQQQASPVFQLPWIPTLLLNWYVSSHANTTCCQNCSVRLVYIDLFLNVFSISSSVFRQWAILSQALIHRPFYCKSYEHIIKQPVHLGFEADNTGSMSQGFNSEFQ